MIEKLVLSLVLAVLFGSLISYYILAAMDKGL